MHVVKTIFICVKLTVVIGFFICAIRAYWTKRKRCTPVPVLLSVYIGILLVLLLLDFTKQYIQGYFYMIYFANLINFIGFACIIRNLPGMAGRKLVKRTRCYFGVMLFLYIFVFSLSFTPRFRPLCTAERVYPVVMNMTCTLFLINFFFHVYVSCNRKYFLGEDSEEIKQALLDN